MLPSTKALRAVEAAARRRSFTGAAHELGLTHGAVAQQIRGLEASLGCQLFVRHGHEMIPTPACSDLAVTLRNALAMIEAAISRTAHVPIVGLLTVSTLPAFATRWLIPRLPRFSALYPAIDVSLRATQALEEPGQADVMASIRYGAGLWPKLTAHRLFGETVFPVCAPELRDRYSPAAPSDLVDMPLLRYPRQPWAPWFQAADLDLPEPTRGPIYSEMLLLLEAAAAGHGVALAREHLVAGDLRTGRLVRLFDIAVHDPFAYHLVWRPADQAAPQLSAFVTWITAEAEDYIRAGIMHRQVPSTPPPAPDAI